MNYKKCRYPYRESTPWYNPSLKKRRNQQRGANITEQPPVLDPMQIDMMFNQPGPTQAEIDAALSELISLVNNQRALRGMRSLTVDNTLMNFAAEKARDYSINDYQCPHVSPRLGSPVDQARAAGYPYYPFELWASTAAFSAQDAFELWLDSPCHRPWIEGGFVIEPNCGLFDQEQVDFYNSIPPTFTNIGVGYYYNPNPSSIVRNSWILILASDSGPLQNGDPYRAVCPI